MNVDFTYYKVIHKKMYAKINYGTEDAYILDESSGSMPKFTKIKQD